MTIPQLTIEQVQAIIPSASGIQEVDRGGQKLVFSGIIDGKKYALKFLRPDPSQMSIQDGEGEEGLDVITARAQREVETMQQCSTPHLVRVGPVGLNVADVAGEPIIYFSEEYINGSNLQQYLKSNGVLSSRELIQLAYHVSEAIDALWKLSKIHRDIKPKNIIRRDNSGEFVLLDMGLVFDLQGDSLSQSPMGTAWYVSPEQMDFGRRRQVLDFRSDLFSLGIVLYEMATGKNPFLTSDSHSDWDVIRNIINLKPVPPVQHRKDLPDQISNIILRLLGKRPALRYRSIELFQRALGEIVIERGNV